MKHITIVYDDSQRPSDEIREITGEKSFGRIIYKRRELKDIFTAHVSDVLEKEKLKGKILYRTDALSDVRDDINLRSAVLLVFSDCIVKDFPELFLLIKKAGYCETDYRIMAGDRVAAVIYHDAAGFSDTIDECRDSAEIRQRAMEHDEVLSSAFADISTRDGFLSFITGGFDARYFNALSGDEYTVVKKSSNKEKISSEYNFYHFLPDSMKSWFVLPYDYREEGDSASYKMQRYHITDLAIRYVHGAISAEEFKRIIDLIFVFLSERQEERVTWNEFYERRRELYVLKVERRISELKQHPEFPRLDAYLKSYGNEGIDEILKRYEDIYDAMIGQAKEALRKTVSHGDLCFSNILYSPDAGLLRLIDPKGAKTEEDIYSDPLYDIAKLSHSIAGQYDFMNSGLYEISVGDDMRLKLDIDSDVHEYRSIFDEKLRQADIDVKTVRLFECSLFLSMLPLHIDSPRKVLAFILNAVSIMDELENKNNGA